MNYHWGITGDVSKVAAYAKASGTDIDASLPYAELWMGTHPYAPSHVLDEDRTTLADLIKKNLSLSTDEIYKQYNGDLPFLFKIQSVGKALSIQAHPDKELGARLFKRQMIFLASDTDIYTGKSVFVTENQQRRSLFLTVSIILNILRYSTINSMLDIFFLVQCFLWTHSI